MRISHGEVFCFLPRRRWLLTECHCGRYGIVRRDAFFAAPSTCRQCAIDATAERATRHGHSSSTRPNSPTYMSWSAMKDRCGREGNVAWERYGGRGISVCDRWHTFDSFLADMGARPEGTSIDRINNDGNYEPTNCRWSTPREQQRNRGGIR